MTCADTGQQLPNMSEVCVLRDSVSTKPRHRDRRMDKSLPAVWNEQCLLHYVPYSIGCKDKDSFQLLLLHVLALRADRLQSTTAALHLQHA